MKIRFAGVLPIYFDRQSEFQMQEPGQPPNTYSPKLIGQLAPNSLGDISLTDDTPNLHINNWGKYIVDALKGNGITAKFVPLGIFTNGGWRNTNPASLRGYYLVFDNPGQPNLTHFNLATQQGYNFLVAHPKLETGSQRVPGFVLQPAGNQIRPASHQDRPKMKTFWTHLYNFLTGQTLGAPTMNPFVLQYAVQNTEQGSQFVLPNVDELVQLVQRKISQPAKQAG